MADHARRLPVKLLKEYDALDELVISQEDQREIVR